MKNKCMYLHFIAEIEFLSTELDACCLHDVRVFLHSKNAASPRSFGRYDFHARAGAGID